MIKIRFDNSILLLHSINWILFGILLVLIFPSSLDFSKLFVITIMRVLTLAVAYYSIACFASPYQRISMFFNFTLMMGVIFILYTCLFIVFDNYLNAYFHKGSFEFYIGINWFANSTLYFILVTLLAHGFYNNNVNLQQLQLKSQYEQDNVRKNILFLRNQFNHHISFNFLNYCYSYVQKNEKSAFIIETYSNMLRYTLDTKPAQPVPVQKEIQYLEQFIALQKELGKNIAVQFITTGVKEKIFILPCILITFVENAFKYGICNDANRPIKIVLSLKPNALEFLVENHMAKTLVQHKSTGIGQINAERHLELYYKKDYVLNINQDDNIYKVQLQINFKS